MDVTQLRGMCKTAPYFHNNSAATLEEALDHYDAFFARAARLNPPPNLPRSPYSAKDIYIRAFTSEVTPNEMSNMTTRAYSKSRDRTFTG